MIVNLYTDAGVKNGIATWGAVCSPPGRASVERCGRMRNGLDDSTAAELRAMANGLHAMIRAGVIERGDEVRVFCDNVRAVDLVNGAPLKHRTRQRHGVAVETIARLAAEAGVGVVARRVAGHQPLKSKDPHAAPNRRADELCTLARRGHRPSPPKPKPKPAGPNKAQRALAIARQLEGRA